MSDSCDVCGRSGGTHVKSKNYNDLYLTILKIGQSRVSQGLSYRFLVSELQKHGYDTNNPCVDLAVRHWFFNSFYHLPNQQNPCNNVEDLTNHPFCNFILKGESSLILIEHETMKLSLKHSRLAVRWAIVAIIVSALAITEIHDVAFRALKKYTAPSPIPKAKRSNAKPSSPNRSDLTRLDTFLLETPNKIAKKNTFSSN